MKGLEGASAPGVQVGIVPCQTCGERHDAYLVDPDKPRGFITWKDPDDGHVYVPMTASQIILKLRETLGWLEALHPISATAPEALPESQSSMLGDAQSASSGGGTNED